MILGFQRTFEETIHIQMGKNIERQFPGTIKERK